MLASTVVLSLAILPGSKGVGDLAPVSLDTSWVLRYEPKSASLQHPLLHHDSAVWGYAKTNQSLFPFDMYFHIWGHFLAITLNSKGSDSEGE